MEQGNRKIKKRKRISDSYMPLLTMFLKVWARCKYRCADPPLHPIPQQLERSWGGVHLRGKQSVSVKEKVMNTKHTPLLQQWFLLFRKVTLKQFFVRNYPQLAPCVSICVASCHLHLGVISSWQSLQKQGGERDFLSFTYLPMKMTSLKIR